MLDLYVAGQSEVTEFKLLAYSREKMWIKMKASVTVTKEREHLFPVAYSFTNDQNSELTC